MTSEQTPSAHEAHVTRLKDLKQLLNEPCGEILSNEFKPEPSLDFKGNSIWKAMRCGCKLVSGP